MIGRAARPFPDAVAQRLAPLLGKLGKDVGQFLDASAAALVVRGDPPSLQRVKAGLNAYDAEVNALRAEGLTRALSTDEVEQFFTLGFVLDQLHRNLADLARCVQEWGRPVAAKPKSPT